MTERSAPSTIGQDQNPQTLERAGSRASREAAALPARRVRIGGVPVDLVTRREALSIIDEAVGAGRALRHVAINAAKLVKAQDDPDLRGALVGSQLATADGQAIVWAARALGYDAPERVTGIDLMADLLDLACRRDLGVYLLGARQEVVQELARRLPTDYPGVRVCGYHHGYFTPAEEASVVQEIRGSGAAMLFVALGTPAKELFLARHHDSLDIPLRMGVGGAFDVMVGRQRRAPVWMQRSGLEWLYRFAQEPRRMWRRYLVGNSRFLAILWRELKRTRLSV